MNLEIKRAGYVPRGAGAIELTVTPAPGALQPLVLLEPGVIRDVRGIALASHLAERHVSATEHLGTNLWLIGQFGARGVVERRQAVVEGLGLTRARATEGMSVGQPAPMGAVTPS